mmetsp:Transcript_432/g.1034  ORF Transcript_432/g.1034 Transcript_432/m.1034 type:complete len:333 (+) Transcript_432:50-1048(+)
MSFASIIVPPITLLSSLLNLLVIFIITLKSPNRHTINPYNSPIRIPHNHILALRLILQQLDKQPHNPPHGTLIQRNLRSKIHRTIRLRSQNSMLVGILGVDTRYKPNLHLRRPRQQRLSRPLGKFEGIILEFTRKDCSSLVINLFTPIDGSSRTSRWGIGSIRWIVLVQCISSHVLISIGYLQYIHLLLLLTLTHDTLGSNGGASTSLLLGKTVQLGTSDEFNSITQIKLSVTVCNTRWFHSIIILLVPEGVRQVHLGSILGTPQDLLSKVLIDHSSLQTQPFRSIHQGLIVILVDVITFVDRCRRSIGRLMNSQVVKLTGVTLVKEQGTSG